MTDRKSRPRLKVCAYTVQLPGIILTYRVLFSGQLDPVKLTPYKLRLLAYRVCFQVSSTSAANVVQVATADISCLFSGQFDPLQLTPSKLTLLTYRVLFSGQFDPVQLTPYKLQLLTCRVCFQVSSTQCN